MIKVVFKNLEKSELAKNIVTERLNPIFEKFSKIKDHQITVTLEMENSPSQAGPDFFKVSTMITGPLYKNIKFEKSSENLYLATAATSDGIHVLLKKITTRIREEKKSGTIKQFTGESIYE